LGPFGHSFFVSEGGGDKQRLQPDPGYMPGVPSCCLGYTSEVCAIEKEDFGWDNLYFVCFKYLLTLFVFLIALIFVLAVCIKFIPRLQM
jgi:hypothetical protein